MEYEPFIAPSVFSIGHALDRLDFLGYSLHAVTNCDHLNVARTSDTAWITGPYAVNIVLIILVLAPFIYGTLSKQNQSIASLLIRRISDVWHLYLHHASVFQERPTQFPIGEMSFSKECVFVHRL